MEPTIEIDVESAFGAVVKKAGGELVSDIVGLSPAFANADFVFQEEGVVIELKCLKKDVLADRTYQVNLGKLFDGWIRRGLIQDPGFGQLRIQVKGLPDECQREVWNLLGNPVRGAVEKANRQIRETKEHLQMPKAKGLLLFANDGCWSLESDAVTYLLDVGLGQRFSSVNSLIYFTANRPAVLPGVESAAFMWLQGSRKGIEPVRPEFLAQLRALWISHHSQTINEALPLIKMNSINEIRGARFIK